MRNTVPVIQRAAGETMNAIKSAISSASPKRAMPACFELLLGFFERDHLGGCDLFKHGQSASRHYRAGRNAVDLDAVLNAAFSKRLGQRFDCRIDRADCRPALGITAALPEMKTTVPLDSLKASHARIVSRRAP